MKTTVLVDRVGYQKEINDIGQEWLNEILLALGIDEDVLNYGDPGQVTDLLFDNQIEVMTYPELGAIKVSHNDELVGEWGGPELTLIEDAEGLLYFKAEIEHWSILDE